MGRTISIAAVLLAAVPVWAQAPVPAPNTAIRCRGEATLHRSPDHVEFVLTKTVSDAELGDALEETAGFEDALRGALEQLELSPEENEVSGISVPDINQNVSQRTARLRFNAITFRSQEKGPPLFAALCGKVRALAKGLGCDVAGPHFGVTAPETVQRQAIVQAAENAYASGDAVAAALEGGIVGIYDVEVVSVTWKGGAADGGQGPELTRVSCTAEVMITYEFAAAGR